jgi:hypothetical protein
MPESDDIFADGARSCCGVAWGQLNRRGLRLDVENICIYIEEAMCMPPCFREVSHYFKHV